MLWSSGCRFSVVGMGWEGRRNGEEIGREGSRKPRSEGLAWWSAMLKMVGHVGIVFKDAAVRIGM